MTLDYSLSKLFHLLLTENLVEQVDEARDILATVVLAHVPVSASIIFLFLMLA